MPWKYFNPVEIIFGEGSLSGLEGCLNVQRILVVTDSRLASSGIMEKVQNVLKNKEIALFGDVHPNPSSGSINACGKLAAESKAETIIGLGGGSQP